MRKLSARRKRVVLLGAVVCLMSLGVTSVAHHSLWVTLPCIGVEVMVLVYMLREVVAMNRAE